MFMEQALTSFLSESDFCNSHDPKKIAAELGAKVGFNNLSEEQKSLLLPFLKIPCKGVELPSGENIACSALVRGDDLEKSVLQNESHNAMLCSDCLMKHEELLQQLESLDCLAL